MSGTRKVSLARPAMPARQETSLDARSGRYTGSATAPTQAATTARWTSRPGRRRTSSSMPRPASTTTPERWNVVNRVWPDETFEAEAHAFAARLAAGPTRAHAATKALVATAVDRGARAADALVPEVSGPLFDTEDLRGAVRSFLDEGPGKASYSGR